MIPDYVLTVGALRALLADVPDRDPVMVAVDGHAAACARRAEHDPGGRTLDILASRLPGEVGVDPTRVAVDTVAVSGSAFLALPRGEPTVAALASDSERGPDLPIGGSR